MTDVYFHTVVLQYYGHVTKVIDRYTDTVVRVNRRFLAKR